MRSVGDLLAGHPFFDGLDDVAVNLVAGCATNVHFRPGEFLFHQDGPADQFYVLRRGRVQLEVSHPGRGQLILETFQRESVLGWSWLIPPYRWEADARATEHTDAIAFDGLCLRGKCDDDPALGYELLKRAAAVMNSRLFGALVRSLDLYGPAPGQLNGTDRTPAGT